MLRLVQLLFAVAVFITTLPAFAIAVQSGYPRRANGRPVTLTSTSTTAGAKPDPLLTPNAGFTRADCFDTKQLVELFLTDIPGTATEVEIWARRDNTSCADPANRPGGAAVQCWKVASWKREEIVAKVVTFTPRQVIQAIDKQISVDNASGLDPIVVCEKNSHMTPVAVSLQIMAFESGQVVGWSSGTPAAASVSAIWTAYDLAGPNPPTDIQVGSGNHLLAVEFTAATTQPPPDFNGYKVYCFPGTASGTSTTDGGALSTKADDAALSDGGRVDDAAVDDSAPVDPDAAPADETGTTPTARDENCPGGDPFVPGELPSPEAEKYVCNEGSAPASGKITVTGLQNGVTYAVAVAGRDKAGNSGTLSAVKCNTPKETDDFYTVYRRAGGTAGGGWCAIGAPRGATFGLAGLAIALAAALRVARRGRR